jgi:hypothetical protein
MKFTQGAQKEAITVAARLTRPNIECSSKSYTHILSVKCLVMLIFQPDIVVVGVLEISCRIPSMTITVMNRTKVSFSPSSKYTNSSI